MYTFIVIFGSLAVISFIWSLLLVKRNRETASEMMALAPVILFVGAIVFFFDNVFVTMGHEPTLDTARPMYVVTSKEVELALDQDGPDTVFKLKDGRTITTKENLTVPKFVHKQAVLVRGTLVKYHVDDWNPFKLNKTTRVTWVRLTPSQSDDQ